MIQRLSHKHRFYLLLTGALVFLLISWKLAIKKTVVLKNQVKTIQEQLLAAENAPQKIATYTSKLQLVESKIGNSISLDKNINQALLEKVSDYCKQNNIKFYELPKAHTINDGPFIIETNKVVLEGNYIKLLKLLYQLETEKRYGKIISAGFESIKDLRTSRTQLYLTVYLQNIRKEIQDEQN